MQQLRLLHPAASMPAMLRLSLLLGAVLVSALPAQMEKRWSDRYHGTTYAKVKPAVGTPAPDLRLWDLAGRPRSLALERGRTILLIGGSYT